jgi:hypothetical protein
MRLYLDKDVSVLVAELLRPHGFDVLTTRDAQNLGQSDADQPQFTLQRHRSLLTHNRCDYEELHLTALQQHQPPAGILIANRRASHLELARRIMTLLNRVSADEALNQLLYL